MKVLEINAVYGYGSTGLIVKDIMSAVCKEGGEAYCAYQGGEKIPNGYVFKNKFDRYFHGLYTRLTGKQGFASKAETIKFLRWVDKIKPDIVHLHNLHGNYINLPMLLKYLAKNDIATVITMHDCWYFTGKCSHYIHYGCNRWQNECGNCPEKKTEIKNYFFDNSKKVVKDKSKYISAVKNLTIVGCSKWIADECKKSRLKDCKITFIRNGIDTSVFKPTNKTFRKENNLNDKFIVLGFANKWNDKLNKSAVNGILNALSSDTVVVIIGCKEEDENYFATYKNVITKGFISDRKTLADIYSSADVFVNLTHADTLPTVNMESICSGTPVITYNVTGSPELVDENSGFVVDENDVNGVIEKINHVKQNGFTFDVKKYQKKFDKNENYKEYLTLFKDMLNN